VLHEPSVCSPVVAPALSGSDWLACGSGFLSYRQALETRYAGQLAAIEPERYPHAREVAQLALPRFAANEAVSSEHAAPVYLRDKVALRTDERPGR
jgi:tRNA threonylcarbamoyladenosine biosynthesis protein TsaB